MQGQAEGVDRQDFALDQACHHRHFAALVINVDAKAPRAADTHGQVHFQVALELGHLFLAHQLVGHALRFAGAQFVLANRLGTAFDLHLRRAADAEKHVRAAAFVQLLQVGVNVRCGVCRRLSVHACSRVA